MERNDKTKKLLMEQYDAYPAMQIRDVFKFLHQSAFGCEHLVSSLEKAVSYIKEEYEGIDCTQSKRIEPLDGDYSRVPLTLLADGLSADTLSKLFYMSAKKEDGAALLKEKLNAARELIAEKHLPFDADAFDRAADEWEGEGFPAVRHSDAFREAYKPAYRVIANAYVPFIPLFAELDRRLAKGPVRLAIEGGSASGKTTLSAILTEVYDCTAFHMDDFFLRMEQRTPERYAEIGGNVDRERFLSEVLEPMSKGEPVIYQPFDCSKMALGEKETVIPKRFAFTEGAYSMHPELSPYYDFSVFLDISPELQRARILRRNSPQFAERFFNEWIPYEKRYFSEFCIPEKCDMRIEIRQSA